MNDYIYPPIGQDLELMLRFQAQDPEYILGGGYSPEVEALFMGGHGVPGGSAAPRNGGGTLRADDEADDGLSKWDRLEEHTQNLMQDLREAGESISSRDNAEKMAYFRTATSLLEKMVGLQERVLNLKRLSRFQQEVLRVMEAEMDGDARIRVREALIKAAQED